MFTRDAIFSFFTHINLCHVFKISAFGTNARFETWMPLVNGCVNGALFNAVPNICLYSWKEWVMHQTEYCNHVIMASLSGRKISKQIKTHESDYSDIKRTILANMNVKLNWWPLILSQGSAATHLRGGVSFNSNFFHRSLMNLIVKKIWKLAHLCRSYSASKLAGNF